MKFDYLDRYLLEQAPSKAEIVKAVLQHPAQLPAAAAFYEGIRLLGARTPELTFVALRLVLAGKAADDERVTRLRDIVERARAAGPDRQAAVQAYYEELA
ncbi:MAG TPA: hypothetical protein VFE17_09420 [Candidatus Baltobacteraceae bacterium]|nr:hypothetical protein [Candidatus Baltobacteraceae bacterium]